MKKYNVYENNDSFNELLKTTNVKNMGFVEGGFSSAEKRHFTVNDQHVLLRTLDPEKFTKVNRKSELKNSAIAGMNNVGPKAYYIDKAHGHTEYVIEFISGRTLNFNDLQTPGIFEGIVSLMKKAHQIKQPFKKSDTPFDRIQIKIDRVKEFEGLLPKGVIQCKNQLEKLLSTYLNEENDFVNCHLDWQFDNLMIRDNQELVLIDFEFSGIDNRFIDLGMLSLLLGLDEMKDKLFLESYFEREVMPEDILKLNIGKLNQLLLTVTFAIEKAFEISHMLGKQSCEFNIDTYPTQHNSSIELYAAYMQGTFKLDNIDSFLQLAKLTYTDFNDLYTELEAEITPNSTSIANSINQTLLGAKNKLQNDNNANQDVSINIKNPGVN